MARQRLPMRKIRDVLRLTAAGLSSRKIAASLSVGATTVVDCLCRARAVGLVWPLPDELTDDVLTARLYASSPVQIKGVRTLPDWPMVHRELRRKGVCGACFGRNTGPCIRTATATASSVICTGPGTGGCH